MNLFPHACVHSHLPLARPSCSMACFRDVSVGTQKSSPFKRRHLITGSGDAAAFEANLEKNRYVGVLLLGRGVLLTMHPHLDQSFDGVFVLCLLSWDCESSFTLWRSLGDVVVFLRSSRRGLVLSNWIK